MGYSKPVLDVVANPSNSRYHRSVMSDKWDYKVYWDEAINILRAGKDEREYNMWLGRMMYLRSNESLILVSAPSNFFRDQVKLRYLDELEQILAELSGDNIKVDFEINGKTTDFKLSAELPKQTELIEEPKTAAKQKISIASNANQVNSSPSHGTPTRKHPQLNTDYTFENFVIGDNNSFAANAAMAIGREPGSIYNPFLIYGGVGLGKTHLIQSIGNYVYEHFPEKKIMYVQMEGFTNEFIEAVNTRKTHLFKAKYRTVDVLLIDDIHFIQGKEGTQEELFYTFNSLYDQKKQMVFTCDRPISEIKSLADRLRSRFERGLNIDLQPPSYETRYAIMMQKIKTWGIHLPEDSLQIVCNNITTNVRDLEKALTKLKALSELMGKEITPEITKAQLKDFFVGSPKKNITIDNIIKEVASYFNLSSQDLKNKRRNQSVAFPRQIAMYIARSVTECSTTEIGLEFGGRDHTTIMHGCQKIADMMKRDPTIEPIVSELTKKIQTGRVDS